MPSDPAPSGRPAADRRPRPLARTALEAVPGVLGAIARQRADDVATTPPWAPAAPVVAATASGFRAAIAGRAQRRAFPAVIAEVKRASPSQGPIADLDPVATAAAYRAGGARAISVLTEPHRFGGDLDHLAQVAARVSLPTLRKDFVVHPRQVEEAVVAGARAVLLIVAVLRDATGDYLRFAHDLGLDALVEVHDEAELELAVAAGADLIGVNNRDLTTLEVDLGTAPRLAAVGRRMHPEITWVAESGYRTARELADLRGTADAVLVGTSLASHAAPGDALRRLLEGP